MAITVYKSELPQLAGKEFASIEEVTAAEAAISASIAEKQAKANQRKEAADKVTAAIKNYNIVLKDAMKAKAAAYKEYEDTLTNIDKDVKAARQVTAEDIQEFCKEYGSYHATIDGTTYTFGEEEEKEVKIPTLVDILSDIFNFKF